MKRMIKILAMAALASSCDDRRGGCARRWRRWSWWRLRRAAWAFGFFGGGFGGGIHAGGFGERASVTYIRRPLRRAPAFGACIPPVWPLPAPRLRIWRLRQLLRLVPALSLLGPSAVLRLAASSRAVTLAHPRALRPEDAPALDTGFTSEGKSGDPGMTRTCDLRFRKPPLSSG